MALADKSCIPCRGGTPPLTADQFEPLLEELCGWQVKDDNRLTKKYSFKNFRQPMELANKIAEIAEEQGHHPDLTIAWGRLDIELWTHKAGGLTESDFVLAAKIDRLS